MMMSAIGLFLKRERLILFSLSHGGGGACADRVAQGRFGCPAAERSSKEAAWRGDRCFIAIERRRFA